MINKKCAKNEIHLGDFACKKHKQNVIVTLNQFKTELKN